MPYNERYKADDDIFKQIPIIDVGDVFLSGIRADILGMEAKTYFKNCSDPEMRTRIPGACVNSVDAAREMLVEYIDRFLFKAGILFCIRAKAMPIPIGYILLNSPRPDQLYYDWSIDFWMGITWRDKKIIPACLNKVLTYMKEMSIVVVKAQVEPTNAKAINILHKLGFKHEYPISSVNIYYDSSTALFFSITLNGDQSISG